MKDYAEKIQAITNGVSIAYWQAPEYAQAETLSDTQLLAVAEKENGIAGLGLAAHYGLWHTWKDQVQGKAVVLWTRLHYRLLQRLDLLWSICKDAGIEAPIYRLEYCPPLYGGRIHQHDDQALETLSSRHLLDLISQDRLHRSAWSMSRQL